MSLQFEKYVKASLPDRYILFGVQLRPLSLGHLLLMKRHQCAFAEEKESTPLNMMDIFIAVAICCRKYQEFIDWYNNDKERNAWLEQWFKYVRKQASKKNFNLFNKISLFNMYRKEGIEIPLYFEENEEQDAGKESGAHWIQNIVSTLVTEGRYNDEEIYDVPISKALSEYFKILENKGAITFMPDWQIEALKKANVPLETK